MSKCRHRAMGLALVALVMAACAAPSTTVHWGAFTPTGSMVVARRTATATLLQDGRVLIVGGDAGANVYASAELYEPKTGTFSATGSLQTPREGNTATVLADGDVLIAGGFGGPAIRQLSTAELYDPKTGRFRSTGSMTTERAGQSATLLPDGRVLIAGGQQGLDDNTGYLASAELYDPTDGTFTATGSMTTKRADHSATLLPDGRALIAGGAGQAGDYGMIVANSAELYDPKTGTFTPTGSMLAERSRQSATLLPDGRVLIVGGASGELYDPKGGTFTSAGSLRDGGASTATVLPDGRVLVIRNPDGDPELYDPASGTFAWRNQMLLGWVGTATLLQDGRVLVTSGGPGPTGKTFLYQP